MFSLLAIDLCGPDVAVYRPSFEAPLYQNCSKVTPLRIGVRPPGPPLWVQLRRPLLLEDSAALEGLKKPKGEGIAPGLDKVEQVLREVRGRLREELASTITSERSVIVLPYRTPPVIRRQLPMLLEQPLTGGASSSVVALEAPVALAIEVVARDRCQAPAHLVLVTGSGPARELSAVTLQVEDRRRSDGRTEISLVVRVLASRPAQSSGEIDEACARIRQIAGGYPGKLGWKFAADGPADDVVEALAISSQARCDPVGDGPNSVEFARVLGAARFVGLQKSAESDGLPMLRGLASAVEVSGPPYAPIGVVGTNGEKGQWFWHQLFPEGARLPARAVIQSEEVGPKHRYKILFAECLGPDHAHRSWLAEEDWAKAGLSLQDFERATKYSVKKDDPDVEFPKQHAWIFDYQERSPGEKLGMTTWSIRYRPPS